MRKQPSSPNPCGGRSRRKRRYQPRVSASETERLVFERERILPRRPEVPPAEGQVPRILDVQFVEPENLPLVLVRGVERSQERPDYVHLHREIAAQQVYIEADRRYRGQHEISVVKLPRSRETEPCGPETPHEGEFPLEEVIARLFCLLNLVS